MTSPQRFNQWYMAVITTVVLFACLYPQGAQARQALDTYTDNGHPLFRFDILDMGESEYDYDGELDESSWTVGFPELQAIREGSRYWAGILSPVAQNSGLLRFIVNTDDKFNASAGSPPIDEGPYEGMTALAASLIHGWVDDDEPLIGSITLGSLFTQGAWTGPMEVLTRNGTRPHLSATLGHELAHALGMLSIAEYDENLDQNAFGDILTTWDSFLVDSYGVPASPGLLITEGPGWVPGEFTVDYITAGYALFTGPNVLAVLGNVGSEDFLNLGLPVNGFESDQLDDGTIYSKAEFSHVELKNVIMSHQNWRNYGVLTEAELAVFRDLGFDIDLKGQFGLSVYESNNPNIVNTTGFYARNAQGTGWLPGVYNTAIGAMGLHIYGANNTVIQAADILSAGPGSAGIRVDGTYAYNQTPVSPTPTWTVEYGNNTVAVAPQVRVHAMGQNSDGLLVAYGKDHVLVNQGEIAALGEGGVGVRFDFGDNLLGNDTEYRGSWMWTIAGQNQNLTDFDQQGLDGSLVNRLDVTGTIAGQAAAIYIAENALVDEINIMSGAQLYGDIISRWNPDDPRAQIPVMENDTTTISFGYAAENDGTRSPIYAADPDFNLLYRGNILGRTGLEVELKGGSLTWQGRMDVLEFNQESGTTLNAIISDSPSVISADSIEIESGSLLGVANTAFHYGKQLAPGPHGVLVFDALHNYVQDGQVVSSSGAFALGAYDYTWANPRFLDSRTVGVDISGVRFNRERGASSAVTAPLALAVHNPASSGVMRRVVDVFNRSGEGAGRAGSMLSAWAHNEAGAMLAATPKQAMRPGKVSQSRQKKNLRNVNRQWIATASGGAERDFPASSLWMSPTYGYSGRSGGSDYSIRSLGMNMGYDVWLTDRVFAGLALTLDFPEYESDHADIDARSTVGTLYGGARLPLDLELGLFASYGRTRYEQKRRVQGNKYAEDYRSDSYGLGANVGRSFAVGDHVTIRPFAAWEYTHLKVDGYGEGMSTYALNFDRSSYDIHRIQAGTDMGWSFDNGAWLSGRVWYEGLQGDTTAATPARFVMDNEARSFTSRGDTMDRHAFGLGAGAGIPLGDTVSLSAGYTFLNGEKTTSHRAEASIRFEF